MKERARLGHDVCEVVDGWGDARRWGGRVLPEACWVGELGNQGWVRHRDTVSVLLAWAKIRLAWVGVLLTWGCIFLAGVGVLLTH